MTSEELNSVLTLKKQIEVETQKLETLKICSESITPPKLSDLPKAKSLTSTTEKFATEILTTEQTIIELQKQLVEVAALLAKKLTSELKNQNSLWLSVMIRRYCAAMTFREIGVSLGYTTDYAHYLHRRSMAFLFKCEYRPARRRR